MVVQKHTYLTYLIKPNDEHPLQLDVTKNYQYKLDRFGVLWLKGDSVMKGYLNMMPNLIAKDTGVQVMYLNVNIIYCFSNHARTDLIKVNSFNVSIGIENALLVQSLILMKFV